jgi:hypothetical protein
VGRTILDSKDPLRTVKEYNQLLVNPKK